MLADFPSHLPFIDEQTLAANAAEYVQVQNDPVYGLRTPGRSGYIINDGPGDMTARTSDNGQRWSKAETIRSGELSQFEHEDDVWIHTVHIVADAVGVSYRLKFVRHASD